MPFTSTAVLNEVLTRVQTITSRTDSTVRRVIRPNPNDAGLYNAQEGVDLFYGGMTTEHRSGAGRRGFIVEREITVVITSRNNFDASGDDEQASIAHCNLEDAIVNAIMDTHPSNRTSRAALCINFMGATEASRFVKRDPGLISSALRFIARYDLTLSA